MAGLRAVEDVGLLGVVRRHGHAARGEALVERGEDVGVAAELEAEGGGDGFAGEVVFGGAEAAGEEDDVGAGDARSAALVRCSRLSPTMVLKATWTPRSLRPLGEVERVGVLPEGREHLRAGGDDFSDHDRGCSMKLMRCARMGPTCHDLSNSNQRSPFDVERDMVEGVAGGEGGAAVFEEGEADEVVAGDGERASRPRGDADDAALAVEGGGDVEVAVDVEGHALGAAEAAGRRRVVSPSRSMAWMAWLLEVVGPVTKRVPSSLKAR